MGVRIEEDMWVLEAAMEMVGADYSSDSRERRCVWYRMMMADVLYSRGHSVSSIARMLNKNHSTVTHYLAQFKNLMEYDKGFNVCYKLFTSGLRFNPELDGRLSEFTTEQLLEEIQARIMNEYYFNVDGLSTMVHAGTLEEATEMVKKENPGSNIEFMRVDTLRNRLNLNRKL